MTRFLKLADDEQSILKLFANRTQGKRAVGGSLHVTTQRVVFCPSGMELSLGGQPWSCAVGEVASVGIERGRFSLLELFSGGLRDRVRLDLRDGRRELFVVARPGDRAAELRELLRVPESGDGLPAARVLR